MTPTPDNPPKEILTFTLGNEEYGIDILKVQEIRGYDAVTKIAKAPDYIKGVINLRGNIVPIVDLRLKFAVGDVSYNEFTVVIILNIAHRMVGVVVDTVSDVLQVDPKHMRPPPDLGKSIDTKYITGLVVHEERMTILVDIHSLLSSEEMQLFDTSTER